MADYFAELKKKPYPLYVAPRPYSFDLNEDMVKLLRRESDPSPLANRLAGAINGKPADQADKIARQMLGEWGEAWMRRTVQLANEYPDRTIEVVLETLDHEGNQFLFFPHVPQRIIEIAYLGAQQSLRLPVTLSNQYELAYRVPQCHLFAQIKDRCGAEWAGRMTCQSACLKALETMRLALELDAVISTVATTAKNGYCEFSVKKL